MLQRGIETLSVVLDPATLVLTLVTADPGMHTGVSSKVLVFARGHAREALERDTLIPGVDLSVVQASWTTKTDGIPQPGTEYVVEMQLEVFETDVAPSDRWDPQAGTFKSLWTRTLRQGEE